MTAPALSSILAHARPSFALSLRNITPTKQSILDNGLKVASQVTSSEVCTLGLCVSAGSRFETSKTSGTSHLLEAMNFKGTHKRNKQDLERSLEKIGATLNAQTDRAHAWYNIRCMKKDAAVAADLLADVVLNSRRTEEDLEIEREAAILRREACESRIGDVLDDYLHTAAFEGSSLGLHPVGNPQNVTKEMIDSFVGSLYTAPNMIFVGSGAVDQGEMCDLASKYFAAVPKGSLNVPSNTRALGGEKRESNDLLPTTAFSVAFQIPGTNSMDFVKYQILQHILGSYTRDLGEAAASCMTRNVVADFFDPHCGKYSAASLASHNPVHSLGGFMQAYSDVALLGWKAVVEAGEKFGGNMDVVCSFAMRDLVRMTQAMSAEEVERAKNSLKVAALRRLDGSVNNAKDIGVQILSSGARQSLEGYFTAIDVVQTADLVALAYDTFYDRDPVVAAVGDMTNFPQYAVLRRLTYWNNL